VIDNVVWTDFCPSIAGAGCGLISVGAGEEQARKVVAGEASRCGEDKSSSFEGPGGQWSQVRAAWWQERQDEVMDGVTPDPIWMAHEWPMSADVRV
jgi:hypothetical protein